MLVPFFQNKWSSYSKSKYIEKYVNDVDFPYFLVIFRENMDKRFFVITVLKNLLDEHKLNMIFNVLGHRLMKKYYPYVNNEKYRNFFVFIYSIRCSSFCKEDILIPQNYENLFENSVLHNDRDDFLSLCKNITPEKMIHAKALRCLSTLDKKILMKEILSIVACQQIFDFLVEKNIITNDVLDYLCEKLLKENFKTNGNLTLYHYFISKGYIEKMESLRLISLVSSGFFSKKLEGGVNNYIVDLIKNNVSDKTLSIIVSFLQHIDINHLKYINENNYPITYEKHFKVLKDIDLINMFNENNQSDKIQEIIKNLGDECILENILFKQNIFDPKIISLLNHVKSYIRIKFYKWFIKTSLFLYNANIYILKEYKGNTLDYDYDLFEKAIDISWVEYVDFHLTRHVSECKNIDKLLYRLKNYIIREKAITYDPNNFEINNCLIQCPYCKKIATIVNHSFLIQESYCFYCDKNTSNIFLDCGHEHKCSNCLKMNF